METHIIYDYELIWYLLPLVLWNYSSTYTRYKLHPCGVTLVLEQEICLCLRREPKLEVHGYYTVFIVTTVSIINSRLISYGLHGKIMRKGNTESRDRPTHVALSIEMNAISWNELLVTSYSDVMTSNEDKPRQVTVITNSRQSR